MCGVNLGSDERKSGGSRKDSRPTQGTPAHQHTRKKDPGGWVLLAVLDTRLYPVIRFETGEPPCAKGVYGMDMWVRRIDTVPFSAVLGEVGAEKGDEKRCWGGGSWHVQST